MGMTPTGNTGFDAAVLAAELAHQNGQPGLANDIAYLDAVISAGVTFSIITISSVQERARIANEATPADAVKIAYLKGVVAGWNIPGITFDVVVQYPSPQAGMLVDERWFTEAG